MDWTKSHLIEMLRTNYREACAPHRAPSGQTQALQRSPPSPARATSSVSCRQEQTLLVCLLDNVLGSQPSAVALLLDAVPRPAVSSPADFFFRHGVHRHTCLTLTSNLAAPVPRPQVGRQRGRCGGQAEVAGAHVERDALDLLPGRVQQQQRLLLPGLAARHCTTAHSCYSAYKPITVQPLLANLALTALAITAPPPYSVHTSEHLACGRMRLDKKCSMHAQMPPHMCSQAKARLQGQLQYKADVQYGHSSLRSRAAFVLQPGLYSQYGSSPP